jgi:hypothetical protein
MTTWLASCHLQYLASLSARNPAATCNAGQFTRVFVSRPPEKLDRATVRACSRDSRLPKFIGKALVSKSE